MQYSIILVAFFSALALALPAPNEISRDVAAAEECNSDWCCDQGVCSVLTCMYLNGQADSCFGCVATCEKVCGSC